MCADFKICCRINSLICKPTPGAAKGIHGHSSQSHISSSDFPPRPRCPLNIPQQAGLSSFLHSCSHKGSGSFLTTVCAHQCLKHLWMTSVRTDFTLSVALTWSHSICYSVIQPYTAVASYPWFIDINSWPDWFNAEFINALARQLNTQSVSQLVSFI